VTVFPSIQRIAALLVVVGLVSVPLSWVPVIAKGGIVLEIPNMIGIFFLLILPFAIFVSRRMWRIHLLFGLMFVWTIFYMGAMILNETPRGLDMVRLQVTQAAFGWTLALAIAHSSIRLSRIAFWAIIVLVGMLHLSAFLTHINLAGEFLNYLITGNRTQFVFRGMRVIFNAFTSNLADVDYVASQINNLANTLVLFCALVFLDDGKDTKVFSLLSKAVGVAFLGVAFVLFSTSAIMVILVICACLAYRAMTRSHIIVGAMLPFVLVSLLIVVHEPLFDFFASNLAEDTQSRGARLGQYEYAASVISDNLLSGVGYFEFGGYSIHNWPLFSWSTAGYLTFLVTLAVYLVFLLASAGYLRWDRNNAHVILPLVTIMLIRTLVGGGGGIPAGSAIAAMSIVLGLLERYRRNVPSPAQALRNHGDPVTDTWSHGSPRPA
jgi:hypothetical protein